MGSRERSQTPTHPERTKSTKAQKFIEFFPLHENRDVPVSSQAVLNLHFNKSLVIDMGELIWSDEATAAAYLETSNIDD